jgi:hypothetical protein
MQLNVWFLDKNVKEVRDYVVSYFINTSPTKTYPIDPQYVNVVK